MRIFEVEHTTVYRYRSPVRFGDHRLMMRPRDGHDLRVVESGIKIEPAARVRHALDATGNAVTVASFAPEPATELRVESRLVVEHRGDELETPPIESFAAELPFAYAADEVPDLARSIERHHPDPGREIDRWARRFLRSGGPSVTACILEEMTAAIRDELTYEARESEGTMAPVETLRLGKGACRDFALLLMEACRSLGLAARFASGYLYDPGAERAGAAGATHGWAQIYLPGSGWIDLDPTHGVVGSRDLVRVAVARDPRLAPPLAGTFTGEPGACVGMDVRVKVRAVAQVPRARTSRAA